jgi:hypothetical protein
MATIQAFLMLVYFEYLLLLLPLQERYFVGHFQ